MLRIAFYFNHYNTLGHSTRIYSLVKGLKASLKKVDILVLQGGKEQQVFPFDNHARLLLLPYSLDKRGLLLEENRRVYKKIIADGQLEKMLKVRLSLIKKALLKFQPDIFITEYFPFGQEFWTIEVPPLLRFLKRNLKCKIISSTGYLSWSVNLYEHVAEFYDSLLIHSPQAFSHEYHSYLHGDGAREVDRVFRDFFRKIYFTGFVAEIPTIKKPPAASVSSFVSRFKKFMLVSRGGGIVNKKIILTSILAAKRNKRYALLVSCGPATPPSEFNAYRRLADGVDNLMLIDFLPPDLFTHLLQKAQLCINMAGYNTTTKILFYGKKCILIPFHTSEQKWRAKMIHRYVPSRIIEEDALTVERLEKSILELMRDDNAATRLPEEWFNGTEKSIDLIKWNAS